MPTASSSPGILFYPRISITGTVGDTDPATLVTATCEIDHGFNIGDAITISGSDVSAHNVTAVVADISTVKIFKYDCTQTDTGNGGGATVVGTASQRGTKLVGGANTYISKNSNDVMVTAASAAGDIEGITTGTNSGLSGGATSGSPTLTLDINNLRAEIPIDIDMLAFNDEDDNGIHKAPISVIVEAGLVGAGNHTMANTAGYMTATNDVNTKWNDGSSEMADLDIDVLNLVTFWNYLAGDTATRDRMSSGVFTATTATAGTYLVTAKVQFHAEDNDGIQQIDDVFYSLSLHSYVHASGGAPASGTLVDLALTVKYTAWVGETLETTFTVNIPDADTFGIYSRIQATGGGGTSAGQHYSHQAGAANGSSLAMIKIGPAT